MHSAGFSTFSCLSGTLLGTVLGPGEFRADLISLVDENHLQLGEVLPHRPRVSLNHHSTTRGSYTNPAV